MKLEIRKAVLEQVQPLLEIFTQANQYKIDRGDRSWAPGFTKQGVIWMIGLGTTYVAKLDDVVVGTMTLEWEDIEGWGRRERGHAGYVRRLAVRDGFHGQYIGEQIINWATARVKQKGRTRLRLDCNPDNKKLCSYYEKLGFKQIEIKYFPDYNSTSVLYEKSIR